MSNNPIYAQMLASLKQEAAKINDAILAVEKLANGGKSVAGGAIAELPNLSTYESAVFILKSTGKIMTTDQILEAMAAQGKKVDRQIAATILYKAVANKKHCEIKRAGRGKWKFSE